MSASTRGSTPSARGSAASGMSRRMRDEGRNQTCHPERSEGPGWEGGAKIYPAAPAPPRSLATLGMTHALEHSSLRWSAEDPRPSIDPKQRISRGVVGGDDIRDDGALSAHDFDEK